MPTKSSLVVGRRANQIYWFDSAQHSSEQLWSAADTFYTIGEDMQVLDDDPEWQYKIAKGQDASNPYTRERTEATPFQLRWSTYRRVGSQVTRSRGWRVDHHVSYTTQTPASDAALRDVALGRLKRKISADLGQWGTVVPVVELRELRKLVKQVALLGVKTMQSLIALRKGNATPITRQIADTWLGFAFGLKPLAKEIEDACKAIRKFLDREDHTVRLRAGSRKEWRDVVSSPNFGTAPYGRCSARTERFHQLTYVYTGGFDFQVLSSNNYAYGAQSTFGMEWDSLPEVFWELTPYSWVFDYFANIGEYLSDTFEVPPGATKYCTLSTLYTIVGVTMPDMVPSFNGSLTSIDRRPGHSKYTYYNRQLVSALPRVGLHVKSVDQIGEQAVSKLLNLGALLVKGIPPDLLDARDHDFRRGGGRR